MSIPVTNKEFLKRMYEAVGKEYTPMSSYVKANVSIPIRHNTCGVVKNISPNHFLKDGRRCSYCFHKNSKSPEAFSKQFEELIGDEYEQCSKYHRSTEKIKVKHTVCNTLYEVTPHAILNGERCPTCFGNSTKTTDEFKQEVSDLSGGEYEVYSDYVNSKTKLVIKHITCGSVYYVTPHDFISGNRCPYCKQSKGEKLIESILKDGNIPYEIQKVFPECGTSKQRLPFDFYLPEYNLLIEYDGEQHYIPIKYYGGDKKLSDQMRRDNIKNMFAKNAGISLLRIPYTLDKTDITSIVVNTIKRSKAEGSTPKR